MWDLIVSVPDQCLSFYFGTGTLGTSNSMWLANLTFAFSCPTHFSSTCAKTIWIHNMSVLILFSCRIVGSCNLHVRMTV